ncbi:MAG: hypothetical protein LBC35_05980 [Coriobacteriales bacterium]|jgi:exopolyphosphatase/guanosine-5'-triphosphate,3'-diphosphate pyrophosphatase|nr:hypothetical protein [Coriobacteriales bacterium]
MTTVSRGENSSLTAAVNSADITVPRRDNSVLTDHSSQIYAAIDLGTVTSRLLLGRVDSFGVEPLFKDMVITNLGEGLSASRRISAAALDRLLAALRGFKEHIVAAQVDLAGENSNTTIPVRVVATSAMRDAHNSTEVLAKIRELGFETEVISGIEEAELSFGGALSGFSSLPEPVLTVDVGGGSTELILGRKNSSCSAPVSSVRPESFEKPLVYTEHSFDVGSRRVTELFLHSDPPTPTELEQAKSWIHCQLSAFIAELPATPVECIAVAGTATSAITIRDEIAVFESRLVHGKRLETAQLDALIQMLAALPLAERQQVIGLHPDRAPVIVGGLLVLQVILEATGCGSFVASDTDILQGILLEQATANGR